MPLPAGHGIAPRPGEAHRVTPSRPCTQGALHGTGPGCQPEPVYSDSTPPSPPGCLAVLPANHCLRCSPASQWGGSRSPRAALSPGWIFTPTNWPGLFMVGYPLLSPPPLATLPLAHLPLSPKGSGVKSQCPQQALTHRAVSASSLACLFPPGLQASQGWGQVTGRRCRMTRFGVGEGRLGEVAKALFALDLLDIYAV